MEKTIFKKGDKVYHHMYGWGIFSSYINNSNNSYCYVIFNRYKKEIGDSYVCSEMQVFDLSFTEYTLNNFSQERQIDYNEWVGKWCMFWDHVDESYIIRKFSTFLGVNRFVCSYNSSWKYCKLLTEEQVKILELETKEM